MHAHDEVEAILDRLEQVLPVVDVDVELAFHGVVDEHARLNVDVVVL